MNSIKFEDMERSFFLDYNTIFSSDGNDPIVKQMIQNVSSLVYSIRVEVDRFISRKYDTSNSIKGDFIYNNARYLIEKEINEIKEFCKKSIDGVWTYKIDYEPYNERNIESDSLTYSYYYKTNINIRLFFASRASLNKFNKNYVLVKKLKS